MEATITTIGDVFKKKVQDSIDVPTIWIDSLTGEERYDYDYLYIESIGSKTRRPDESETEEDLSYMSTHKTPTLRVRGPIKQIGSHVIDCGNLTLRPEEYPFLNDLTSVFRHAKNLEVLGYTFADFGTDSEPLVIPEDLLWKCPKIKKVYGLFSNAHLAELPANLFLKCQQLENVSNFCHCAKIDTEEVPADLFKNNPNIKNFRKAFELSNVTKVPNTLLSQFKDGIDNGTVKKDDFLRLAPAAKGYRIKRI